jgi:SAM-dependent methyltransferase
VRRFGRAMPSDTLYEETAYYRLLFAERTQDLPFYLRATEGIGDGELLELGVGDGRVAFFLAAAGRRVFGVDISAPMLAALEAALPDSSVRARVRVRCADTRTLQLGCLFARVICPFNGIAHFRDTDALAAFFSTVRAHLADGGLFAFDAMIPDSALLEGGGASVPWLVHPRTGAVCRLEEAYAYDPAAQVLTITTTFVERESGERQVLSLALRQFFPDEMPSVLERHGFSIVERDESIGDSIAYLCRAR